MSEAIVGAYGKLADTGDFVQHGPASGVVRRFRDWLHLAVESDRRAKFEQAAAEQVFAFLFRDPEEPLELLVGALRPSRDAVGRSFPLAIYAGCDGRVFADCPHLVPRVLESFFARVQASLQGAGDLPTRLALVSPPLVEQVPVAVRDAYHAALGNTGLLGFWNDLFGTTEPGALDHALAVVEGTVEPWRGQELPPTPLSVRLPIGRQGTTAVAFWMDVVRRLAGWRRTVPTTFWQVEQGGSVLVLVGQPPASSLPELWVPDPDSDHVCDLTTLPQVGLQPSPQLSATLRRTHHETTCADFIDALI